MYLDKAKKEEIFGKYSHNGNAADTGSAESQIALFSYRIAHLTEHLKQNTTNLLQGHLFSLVKLPP
jgi:small subunit ribosomal protein S15